MNLQIAGVNIDATAIGASVKSDWLALGDGSHGNVFWEGCSVNLAWTGSGVGTFALEGANLDDDDFAVPLDKTAETSDGSPVLFNVQGAKYRYIRLAYTRTSGTITLTALAVRK